MTIQAEERRSARLAAVQALYQMEISGEDAEEVAEQFVGHRFAELVEAGMPAPDEAFFTAILQGVPAHQVEIDRAIASALSQNWKLDRVDSILRAILRCGMFELVARRDVPAKVVIDEYIAVAGAFFGGDEPGFVNAVLDSLARRKRAKEFGLPVPEGEIEF
ncbi:MAG TPA: transcription antitermination factor NusB [Rhizomicrobium sp.]|jgi:N utilization substance protein B|nr:transcription antitermination factor NusB [Rhizomicrobium sp.]HVZ27762.1 transcription antitermination factor NusB [Rhizomicrobium sp.]